VRQREKEKTKGEDERLSLSSNRFLRHPKVFQDGCVQETTCCGCGCAVEWGEGAAGGLVEVGK
jgi:hypothetical protein